MKNFSKRYTFEQFKAEEGWQRQVLSAAKAFANLPEGWFFIGGQPGSGKTHLCVAAANELLQKGRDTRYMVWNDVITKIKSAANDRELYDAILNRYKNAEVLYIDDFFKSKNISAADIDHTFKIINYRYNENKTTIISSELSISEIIEIDEGLGSRIVEMVNGRDLYIAKDASKNYRYKKKAFGS